MIKILFLINTLTGGGAEKVLLDLVNSLPKDKYDVTLQCVDDRGLYIHQLDDRVHYKAINHKKGLMGRIFAHLLTFNIPPKRVYEKYVKDDYDIEVAFLEGLPTKILAHSTNKKAKKIAWVHIDLMTYFGSVKVYKSEEDNRLCYTKFDKIACVSEAVKEKFIERFGDTGNEVEAVYNILLDEDIKRKGEEPLGVDRPACPLLLSCGRLAEQKGYERLLRIHKRLLDEGFIHHLWIAGEGALRPQLDKYIEENSLGETAKLLGFQSNPYKFMKAADLFVCSSIAEGYSMVVSEAVILGTPVISTDVVGMREPFDHPRCYKVVDNDEESLYRGIKGLLEDKEELAKAKKYAESISPYFKKEALLKGIMKFIGE